MMRHSRRSGALSRFWLVSMAVLGVGLAGFAWAAPAVKVMTSEGRVSGMDQDGVRQYLGIPYAAPPTGERRWTMPQPPARRHGVLNADHFRDACPQVSRFNLTEASDAEDCLYLNIAVPTAPTREPAGRPVLFWIHGGAYVGGGANLYRIDHLARTGDLLVVSINYRLGALGFLAHPGLSREAAGAFGLADQQAALRWVHRNIRRFGGDPNRITIAGESAGAASVCALLATPEHVGGLYARAIIQSAGCGNPWRTVADAGEFGTRFAESLGCKGGEALACLRRVPLAKLLEAQTQMAATGLVTWAPSVGSKVLPRQPKEAVAEGLVRVPVMNGGTRDEMRLYIGYEVVGRTPYSDAEYSERLTHYYGDKAAEVKARYPAADYSSPSTALGTALSDFGPMIPLSNCVYLRFGREMARHTTVYEYEFADRQAPPVMEDPGIELGAVHSAELPYFFPGFSNRSVWDGPPLSAASHVLSQEMIAYWASFARSGVPSAAGKLLWPPMSRDDQVLRLDAGRIELFNAEAAHQCAFFRSLYPQWL